MSKSVSSYRLGNSGRKSDIGFKLMLIICMISVHSASTIATTCSNLNPFYTKLVANGVTGYSVPTKIATSKCGAEWSSYGTCCSEQDLVRYAVDQIRSIGRDAMSIKVPIKLSAQELKDLNTTAETVKKQGGTNANLARLVDKLNIVNSVADFRDFMSSVLANTSFETELDKCTATIIKARNNALCGTCSGRSKEFFFKNRGLVTEANCKSILTTCSKTFRNLLVFIENAGALLAEFQWIAALLKNNGKSNFVDNSALNLVPFYQSASASLKSHQLVGAIQEYMKGNPTKGVTATLCYYTLSLSGPSIITTLSGMIKNVGMGSKIIVKAFKDFLLSKTRRRVLQSPPQIDTFNPLGGDVKMVISSVDTATTYIPATQKATEVTPNTPLPLDMNSVFP